MKAILLTIYVVSLLSACTTGEQMSRLEPGMTRQQVVGILGRPNAVRSNGPYEQLEYTHRLITGWSWDRSDFKVILKDGRVIEFGHGEVRDRTPQVVYNATPTLTPARAYYDDQQGQLDRIEQQNRDIQQDLENQRAARSMEDTEKSAQGGLRRFGARYKQNPASMTVAVRLAFRLRSGRPVANTLFLFGERFVVSPWR